MKISVLGCGWLGLPIAAHWVEQGHEVRGSVRSTNRFPSLERAGILPVVASLHDPESFRSDFWKADVLVCTLPPQPVQIVEQALEYADKLGQPNMLWVSATSVYPDTNGEVTEKDAEHRTSPHSGVDLLQIENTVRQGRNDRTTVIRFCGLYGPGREPGRFLRGKTGLAGANTPVNLIHLDDCASILAAVVEQEAWGHVFNACSDIHPTREVFYTQAAQKLGIAIPEFDPEKRNRQFKRVNSDRMKETLDYTFIHPDPLAAL